VLPNCQTAAGGWLTAPWQGNWLTAQHNYEKIPESNGMT
jgi:hypothetical protein